MRVPPGQELHVVDDLGDQIPKIESGIWPAFPADLTSIAVVAATQARGTVLVFEKMFESRLFFVDKLVSMGARIILCDPHRVVVTGPAQLYGQRLESPDIRAGMAMVIAALCAEGALDDRQHRPDRPRLRANRRAPAARSARRSSGRTCERRAHHATARAPSNVATGVPVLDHLLAELARAAGFDLALEIEPDDPEAEVDAAGTALGRAVAPRLAPTAPSARRRRPPTRRSRWWSSSAPDRPLVASNADLTGAGGLGTDLAARFLGRLSEEAGLTVHVRLIEGEDTGHALAAIFKALGVALARAADTA